MFYNEADTFWRPTVAPNVWAPVVSYAATVAVNPGDGAI